jgi:hypothetical protein
VCVCVCVCVCVLLCGMCMVLFVCVYMWLMYVCICGVDLHFLSWRWPRSLLTPRYVSHFAFFFLSFLPNRVFVLITVCAPPDRGGTTQGFCQSVASLARGFGPLTGGILFAWSLSTSFPFPFDIHMVTSLLAFFGVVQLFVTFFFKDLIEHQHTTIELPIGE